MIRADEDDCSDSDPELSELVLIPDHHEALQTIYDAIKVCQALNPDPADVDDEEEDEDDDDNLFADAEEEMVIEPEDDGAEDPGIS